MIQLRFRDMLTRLRLDGESKPGMDLCWYTQDRLEEDLRDYGATRNAEYDHATSVGYVDLEPWPVPFPAEAWVDASRYTDDLRVQLMTLDGELGVPAPAPAGDLVLEHDHGIDSEKDRLSSAVSWRDVQASNPDLRRWMRLDSKNESVGMLGTELVLRWRRVRAGRHRLVVPDNALYTPFDATDPGRYLVVSDGGALVGEGGLDIGDGETVVYLKPRRWRFLAKTIAHYLYVTPFESVPNDELFIMAWHDRTPFWPVRTDAVHTAGRSDMYWFDGTPLAWDDGIEYYWEHCRHYGELVQQIVSQQYFSMCVSYILVGVEPAMITVEQERVRAGEVVAILERRDDSGVCSRTLVVAREDEEEWYPRTVVGVFYGDLRV